MVTITRPRQPQTIEFERALGPFVVDVWEPDEPSNELPILLVHGWGGSGSYWRIAAERLSRTNRVIVPDLPGTGRSQPVATAQDMFDQVHNLARLLDYLELERVQVIGHSMGGAMTVLLADQQPDRLDNIVLTSLSFFMNDEQVQIYRNVMRGFKATFGFRNRSLANVPGMTNLLAGRYFYRIPNDRALLRQGLVEFLELDAGTASACADNAPDPRIREAGSRVQSPVLLIACRQDQVMPLENVDFTCEIIPDCRVIWMDECGHVPMVEKPDEFLGHVGGFLRLG